MIVSSEKNLSFRRDIFRALLCFFPLLSALFHQSAFANTPEELAKKTRVTLDEVDQVISSAQNLDDFLGRPELQEKYYNALKDYFGEDRFSRMSFDKIIEQLTMTQAKFPEIAERAWQTGGMGASFKIKMQLKSSGLRLKQEEFSKWLDEWKMKLRQAPHTTDPSFDAAATVAKLEREIASFYEEVSTLRRDQRAIRSGEFFRDLTRRPEFKTIANRAIVERLSEERVNDLLGAGDADLVLETFELLRRSTDYGIGGKTLPRKLQALIGKEIPSFELPKLEVREGKGAETALFAAETIRSRRGQVIAAGKSGNTEYELRPIPRRIHGLFKGIPIKECVAGNCKSLESMTPERWASVLLDDARLYHVEKLSRHGPEYQGFVQLVPGEIRGKPYVSVDLGSPLFGKKVVTEDGQIGIFYDLWLSEAIKHLPPGCAGIVISESDAVDNAGVLPKIRKRPSYLFGSLASLEDRFVVRDDLAKKLSSLGIRQGYAKDYAGRTIFEHHPTSPSGGLVRSTF